MIFFYRYLVARSSPDEVDFFSLRNPSSRTMVLGSTQPLTEMCTKNISGGKDRLRIDGNDRELEYIRLSRGKGKKVKLSLKQTVESCRVVRCRGSHIF
jgi:hypothetical protein